MRSSLYAVSFMSVLGQKHKLVSDPVYACPHNFNLNGKICEHQITAKPQLYCTEGELIGIECVVQMQKLTRCPIGTMMNGKSCISRKELPARQICPTGFIPSVDGCTKQEALPLIEICQEGVKEGPICVTLETAPYKVTQRCPPGYEDLAKGGCWKRTTYDCTPAKGAIPLRGLKGIPTANAIETVIKQTCERKEAAPIIIEKECPREFTDDGKSGCIHKTIHPTVTMCSNGASMDNCKTTRVVPYDFECTVGILHHNNMCVSQVSSEPESYCATGEERGGVCLLSSAAKEVCPAGLNLTGGLCIGLETAPPQVTVTVTCTGKNCHNN